jgi:hypothetical protein
VGRVKGLAALGKLFWGNKLQFDNVASKCCACNVRSTYITFTTKQIFLINLASKTFVKSRPKRNQCVLSKTFYFKLVLYSDSNILTELYVVK